ncbi:exported hypothetical protein [Candidatus Sulfopaludibacter sp. SbA4]|nr:exported hypothetical protein [Candidatus Sulfopaludibacter sp. SbA4]
MKSKLIAGVSLMTSPTWALLGSRPQLKQSGERDPQLGISINCHCGDTEEKTFVGAHADPTEGFLMTTLPGRPGHLKGDEHAAHA